MRGNHGRENDQTRRIRIPVLVSPLVKIDGFLPESLETLGEGPSERSLCVAFAAMRAQALVLSHCYAQRVLAQPEQSSRRFAGRARRHLR